MRTGPLDRLATTASLVFIADFATKQWALHSLGAEGDHPVVSGWHLAIVNNTHLAGGLESAGVALPITLVLTTVVALLAFYICEPIAAIDARAPATLGLLLGAGAANLADALIPPNGVVDFIAFTSPTGATTSFNLADAILAIALVLCVRTIWRIWQNMLGRKATSARARHHPQRFGALAMRDRALVSAGHALLAMCGFVWLYSMAIAWTRDAGRSAPNSLLCGVGVFALTFLISQARMRLAERRVANSTRSFASATIERVVLDGSIPMAASAHDLTTAVHPRPVGDLGTSIEQRSSPQDPGIA